MGSNLLHAVFLIQKEVAERVVAQPGSRDYGFLSVQVQVYAEPKYLFTVPPDAFRPPPQVDSAVIELTPRSTPVTDDPTGLVQFAGLCFRQKRKMLRNNLAGAFRKGSDRCSAGGPIAGGATLRRAVGRFTGSYTEVFMRVRFAPSPTGYLHIGSARTFIFNWLYARHNGGTVILRIDDTDLERNTEASLNSIFDGLELAGSRVG